MSYSLSVTHVRQVPQVQLRSKCVCCGRIVSGHLGLCRITSDGVTGVQVMVVEGAHAHPIAHVELNGIPHNDFYGAEPQHPS